MHRLSHSLLAWVVLFDLSCMCQWKRVSTLFLQNKHTLFISPQNIHLILLSPSLLFLLYSTVTYLLIVERCDPSFESWVSSKPLSLSSPSSNLVFSFQWTVGLYIYIYTIRFFFSFNNYYSNVGINYKTKEINVILYESIYHLHWDREYPS